jgi:hypothetical protein
VRLARRIVSVVLGIVLIAVGAGLLVRIYLGRAAEDRLAPDEAVAIAELRPPLPGNSFLACPPKYCAIPDAMPSPVFDMPWRRLRDYWQEMIAGDRRLTQVAVDIEDRRFVFIRRSPWLRFPDIVTVEFAVVAPGRSSLAIYSRSRYGRYDFNANRKRIEKWIFLLHSIAQSGARMH